PLSAPWAQPQPRPRSPPAPRPAREHPKSLPDRPALPELDPPHPAVPPPPGAAAAHGISSRAPRGACPRTWHGDRAQFAPAWPRRTLSRERVTRTDLPPTRTTVPPTPWAWSWATSPRGRLAWPLPILLLREQAMNRDKSRHQRRILRRTA